MLAGKEGSNEDEPLTHPPRRRTWAPVGLALLVSAVGCSTHGTTSGSRGTSGQQENDIPDGGAKTVGEDPAVSAALARMEATGKLEGVQFERLLSGGLVTPPYPRDQFMLLTWDGHDTFQLATHGSKRKSRADAADPFDVYRLPAQPDDVKTIARLLRETKTFDASTPRRMLMDGANTTFVLTIDGTKHQASYSLLPPALMPLGNHVQALIARVRAQGWLQVEE